MAGEAQRRSDAPAKPFTDGGQLLRGGIDFDRVSQFATHARELAFYPHADGRLQRIPDKGKFRNIANMIDIRGVTGRERKHEFLIEDR